jgi:D-alanyl-D-alanine dipeptidase
VYFAKPFLTGPQPATVPIGYTSHRLVQPAANAYRAAGKAYGSTIPITDSFRTTAQQEQCHREKPTLCAVPGRSMHERGLAIDIDTGKVNPNDPKLLAALTGTGWRRFSPTGEPWHWSYGVIA